MRTVVALYGRLEDAYQAVQALVDEQFPREDITLVSRDATGAYAGYLNRGGDAGSIEGTSVQDTEEEASAGIGAVLGGIGGLLLGLSALMIPGIGPVIASGPLVATLAGAGVGALAGGLIGGLVNMGVPEEHAQYYAEGIRRGGTLIVIRTKDQDAERARQILNRFRPVDLETHMRAWREAGWNHFDPNAQPLQAQQMEFNRTSNTSTTGNEQATDVNNQSKKSMDEHKIDDVFNNNEQLCTRLVNMPVTGEQAEDMEVSQGIAKDWSEYDADFRQDYLTHYGQTGYGYDYYQPAYRFGYDLATDPRYDGYEWNQVESEARRQYERSGLQGSWDDVKEAVQHAWKTITCQ